MHDKVGDIRGNEKAINPKGKKGSTATEQQTRLVGQFMNASKNDKRPSEPTLLQKLVKQSKMRKKPNVVEEKTIYTHGISSISEKTKTDSETENSIRLANLLSKYNTDTDTD